MSVRSLRAAVSFRRVLAACLLAAAAGCVQRVTGETVEIDVPYIGAIAPGTMNWLAWPQAVEQCGASGKEPKLVDLRGTVAVYRCLPPE